MPMSKDLADRMHAIRSEINARIDSGTWTWGKHSEYRLMLPEQLYRDYAIYLDSLDLDSRLSTKGCLDSCEIMFKGITCFPWDRDQFEIVKESGVE